MNRRTAGFSDYPQILSRYFIGDFNEAFLSRDLGDALWERFSDGSAATTEAVRRVIQHSQESLRAPAKRYGVKPGPRLARLYGPARLGEACAATVARI
jgi:hypothetical protein